MMTDTQSKAAWTAQVPAANAQDSDEIDLREYWNIIWANKWLVATITAAILALVLELTLLATPIYRARTMLQIERESVKVLNVEGVTDGETTGAAANDFYQTQYQLLSSQSLAQRVVQDLALTNDPKFKSLAPAAASNASTAERLRAHQRKIAEALLRSVNIEPVRNSRLVNINVDSPDAKFAARVSNAWADAFIASQLEKKFDASSYARKYLEDRLAQLKARLEDTERELVSFASAQQIVSVGDDQPSLSAQNLSELNASLAKAQDERIRAEAEWSQISRGSAEGAPQVMNNALIQGLRQQRAKLKGDYQEKLATYKPDYPDMQRLAAQISEVERQINGETGNVRAAVKAKYDAAVAQEQLLNQRIGGLKGDVLDLQNRSIQYNILKREAETNRQLYDGMLQRYKEIGIAGGIGANNIFVVDRADVPERPYKPNLLMNLAIALLAGLMLGVLAAFVRQFLDRTITNPKTLEHLSHRPVLGIIPKLGGNTTPAQASADLRSPFSEAYRSVRTALQFATPHGLPATLFITSPSAAEGKSTTALELARNIAQLGKRVVLVDADMRNPSVHKLTRLNNSVGLSNVLSGAAQTVQALQLSEGDKIQVITSGPLPPNPPELLAGDGLKQMLEALTQAFDVVVLDGPPVLGLADAPLLAHAAEATLVVATADKTRKDTLEGALARLDAARSNVLGSVLSGFDPKKGDSYGYGGYAYYSYGGKDR